LVVQDRRSDGLWGGLMAYLVDWRGCFRGKLERIAC